MYKDHGLTIHREAPMRYYVVDVAKNRVGPFATAGRAQEEIAIRAGGVVRKWP